MVFRKIATIKSFKTSQKEKGWQCVGGEQRVGDKIKKTAPQKKRSCVSQRHVLSEWLETTTVSSKCFLKLTFQTPENFYAFPCRRGGLQRDWRLRSRVRLQLHRPLPACSRLPPQMLAGGSSTDIKWEHIFKIFRYYKKETVFCIWLTAAGKDLQDAV